MKDKIVFYEDNIAKEGQILLDIKYQNNEYIVYTDNSKNENNQVRLLASKIKIENEEINILPIETEDEWKYIDNVLGQMKGYVCI